MGENIYIARPKLGAGIYTVPDISQILNLNQAKARRWLHNYWNSRMNLSETSYTWGNGRDLGMDFLMLIEFYVFYKLREIGISSQKIITAHNTIANYINSPFPFAKTKIFFDKEIFFCTDNLKTIIKADETKQIAFNKIILEYVKKIDFDQSNDPLRFWPLGKNNNIVVDPHHQFGRPVIKGTNIKIDILYDLFKAGESKKFIANLYNIDVKSVSDSINYFLRVA